MESTDGSGGGTPAPSPAQQPAAPVGTYRLVSSYSTVQVVSPTLVNDIVYCTIQTLPSGVIASTPVQQKAFDDGSSAAILTSFAQAIEQVMTDPRVTHGVGTQALDASGLLVDSVVFTVEYTDPVKAPNGVTAQVAIPIGQLNFGDADVGPTQQAGVVARIDAVYGNLKAAAGG